MISGNQLNPQSISPPPAVWEESEENDTIATADILPDTDAFVAVMLLDELDVDVFSVYLEAGEVLTAMTTPLYDPFYSPDTMLALLDAQGVELAFNDDSGEGDYLDDDMFGSMIIHRAAAAGNYYLAVSGWNESHDTYGEHEEYGEYALTTSIVPEPATLSLLAFGMLAAIRRRRK